MSLVRAYQFAGRWTVLKWYICYHYCCLTCCKYKYVLVDIVLFIILSFRNSYWKLHFKPLCFLTNSILSLTHTFRSDQCWNVPDKDRWLPSIDICLYCLSIVKNFASENEKVKKANNLFFHSAKKVLYLWSQVGADTSETNCLHSNTPYMNCKSNRKFP